jgi:hypothetical protein
MPSTLAPVARALEGACDNEGVTVARRGMPISLRGAYSGVTPPPVEVDHA